MKRETSSTLRVTADSTHRAGEDVKQYVHERAPSFDPIQFFCSFSYCIFPVKSLLLSKSRLPPHGFQWQRFVSSVSPSYQQRQQHLQQTSRHQCFRLWCAGRFDIFWANRLQIDLFLALISFLRRWRKPRLISRGAVFSSSLFVGTDGLSSQPSSRCKSNLGSGRETSAGKPLRKTLQTFTFIFRLPGFCVCRVSRSARIALQQLLLKLEVRQDFGLK